MSDEKEVPMGHSYDGIEEYDNPLPAWWLITFFGTIIFGFHYWLFYEFGGGATQIQELKDDLAVIRSLNTDDGSGDSEEALAALLKSEPELVKGQGIYAGKCAVCHGPELQGLIGPNLVDAYWIHGRGKLVDIATVVRKGVLDKGMPNWETQLKPDEIRSVTAFVYSHRGDTPANAKPPQGEKVDQE